MLFLTEYELKPTLVPSDTKRLMDEFAKRGQLPANWRTTCAPMARAGTR